jgi:Mg-chelatase subunit ChlD
VIDWGSIQVAQYWPLVLALLSAACLCALWFYRRKGIFPDVRLLANSGPAGAVSDRLPVVTGAVLLLLLTLAMMEPSVVRVETIDQRARDFLILVDTSRSMRHDTQVRRDEYDLHFERRVGAFSTAVDDPRDIPHIARYELARESLMTFLNGRRAEDRVGLIYFNDNAHSVSALTSNIEFVVQQLASMDDYVNWGTNIAAAVDSGLNLLERYPDQNKRTVILLTDAETRYTNELEQQLARLANADLSFYLLWITTDKNEDSDEDVTSFLKLATSVGNVVTIRDLDSENLQNALLDVSRMEGYRYQELRRRIIDLTQPILQATRILLIVWLLSMATIFRPIVNRMPFEDRGL